MLKEKLKKIEKHLRIIKFLFFIMIIMIITVFLLDSFINYPPNESDQYQIILLEEVNQ